MALQPSLAFAAGGTGGKGGESGGYRSSAGGTGGTISTGAGDGASAVGNNFAGSSGGGGGGAGGGAGGAGGDPLTFGGGGGAGGNGGAHGGTLNGGGTVSVPATGSAGGDGGNGLNNATLSVTHGGGGGGGGEGGYGVVAAGGGTATISSNVTGGIGGSGGDGASGEGRYATDRGFGGNGGDGGVGIFADTPMTTINVQGSVSVTGGAGGIGGAGFAAGAFGKGGSGIVGSDLTVHNSGTISGGLSGDGVTRGFALDFTGGSNTLTLATGSTLVGGISVAGTLNINQAVDYTLSNVISGTGNLMKSGGGVLTLSGTNTYSGTTTVSGGNLAIGSDGNLGAGALVFDGGTLAFTGNAVVDNAVSLASGASSTIFTGSNDVTLTGVISGSGNLATLGSGTLTLSGTNTYTGTLTAGGTVIIASGDNLGEGALTLTGGTLSVTGATTIDNNVNISLSSINTISAANGTVTMSGAFSGGGSLVKTGGSTLVLSGTNTQTGNTTVSGGTLSIGSQANLGSGTLTLGDAAVRVTGNTTLANAIRLQSGTSGIVNIDSGVTVESTGLIWDSGNFIKFGGGKLVVSGTSNNYTGTTTVLGGTLQVDGSLGNTAVTVQTGATLGGSGTIAGAVNVLNGGTLSPGSSPGTLTVDSLVLNSTSQLNFELDTPGTVGGGVNDLVSVTHGLTLDGVLNIIKGSNFGTGTYRLFNYGTLTADNGLLLGDVPAGYELSVTTGTAGQVNLTTSYTGLQFWNGTRTTANGSVNGGSGTWNGSSTNWTSQAGNVATSWADLTAVFAGNSGGIVAVTGNQTAAGLQFATDGYTLSGTGSLVVGSGGMELRIDNGLTATIATTVTGAGAVNKTGAGTIVLSGINTYTGGTALNAGTLSVSQDLNLGDVSGGVSFNGGTLASTDSFSTARSMVFNSAGRFDVATGTELRLAGALSGTGGLVKSGDGTLRLTSTSGYSGGTMISAGTLQIGDGGTSGTLGAGDIVNNGALVFNRSDVVTFAGNMTGTGTLEQAGSGTLVVTGKVDVTGATTISSGTLQIGDGSTTGEVTGPIVNNGTLVFNRSDNYTVPGSVSGTGRIDFKGSGRVEFAGTYSGSTAVTDAKLVLSGNGLTGTQVSVGGSGTTSGILAGNGTIGGLTVLSGGIVAPGNSIGTINVAGAVSFGAGSVYEVEVNANGTSDRVIATGAVTIDSGASVRVLAESGTYAASTTYSILSGASVSGQFNPAVTTNFAFLKAALGYSATDVLLTLTRNETGFAQVGTTPNEIAVASGIASLPGKNDLAVAVTALSADGARNAFNQLSGEQHASLAGQTLQDSAIVRGTALRRLSQEAFDRRFEGGDLSFEGTRLWGEALGSFGRARASDTAFGFSRNMGGLVAGIETQPTDSAMAGIMGGYTGSYLDNKQLGSTATVTAYHAGIYGSYDFAATDMGAVSLRGGASYSWQDISTRRNVNFGNIGQRLDADYDAGQVQGFGELAYGHMFSGVMQGAFLEGFTGLALVRQDGAKFTETGGSAALTGRGKSLETAFSTLGVRGAVQTGFQGIPVKLTGELAWRHAFGDVAATQTMTLAGSTPFAIRGRALDRDAFLIGTGVSMTMTEKLDLSLAYQGELASKATDHSVKGSFRLRF